MSDRDAFEQRPYELPPGAAEIILVRHGASAAAVPGVRFPLVNGQSDPPLADAGHSQAEAIAERLRSEPLSGLFVTPLQRTHQTAAPLAEVTGLEPEVVPDLAEVRLGEWEGGEYRVRAGRGDPIVREVFRQERWDLIPGGESFESFSPRVRRGIEHIAARTEPGATAVAVLHGAVIGEVCRQATGSRPFAFVHADNGSLTRLVVLENGRWLLRCFNDISHLSVRTGAAG
jgi:probable phosphoglycerate mutase